MTEKQKVIDLTFMRLAWTYAISRSKDPSTQVCSIITTPDFRQWHAGFNGMPKGVLETRATWSRPAKYERVCHAEINCLTTCPFDKKGCYIYQTHQPCHKCLGQIINSEIVRLVYNEPYERDTNTHIYNELISLIPEVVVVPDEDLMLKWLKENRTALQLNKQFT